MKEELKGLLGDNDLLEKAHLTLIAVSIFENRFEEREDEWKLIVAKALKFLKSLGLKPEPLLKKY